jgi:hypothetical protein
MYEISVFETQSARSFLSKKQFFFNFYTQYFGLTITFLRKVNFENALKLQNIKSFIFQNFNLNDN